MIDEFCDWLSKTPLSLAFQSAERFVPSVQIVHIISISILLIAVYVLSFRLVGLTRKAPPLATLAARSSRWIWAAFSFLLFTGILLTITEPTRELLNWVFRIKMLLVAVLVGVLMVLQITLRGDAQYWSSSPARRLAGQVVGIACIVLGAFIVIAGRWIAYV